MAVAISNADPDLNLLKPWYITPDGEGRYTVKKVVVAEFPEDPDTHQQIDVFYISAGELGLPYIERVEVELPEDCPVFAEFDGNHGAVRVDKVTDGPAEFIVTAYGPPEFTHPDP